MTSESTTTQLKEHVRQFWNEQSCDTQVATASKFSREYFEQIERFRYADQPFIHSFAQFTRYRGKRVLEVGFGAGTDFIQWLRAGAVASGVDLTAEALAHLRRRIEVYGLPQPERIEVADAENLPFEDNGFDLGYSFGVLHHSPHTERAIRELVRVVKPGGEIKIMLYNRHSIYVLNAWIKHALLRGKPWKSLAWVLRNHMESVGTKGYTRNELISILSHLPVDDVSIQTETTAADYLSASAFKPLNLFYRCLLRVAGTKFGWNPSEYVARINAPDKQECRGHAFVNPTSCSRESPFTGNRLGFFHCITARKSSRAKAGPSSALTHSIAQTILTA